CRPSGFTSDGSDVLQEHLYARSGRPHRRAGHRRTGLPRRRGRERAGDGAEAPVTVRGGPHRYRSGPDATASCHLANAGRSHARSPPPRGRRLRAGGGSLAEAKAAVVMLHGRGAPAESILELAEPLATPGVAFVAPQAAGGTWYPYRFIE